MTDWNYFKDKKDFITSDVEDLKFIGDNMYAHWIELAKFCEEFNDEDMMRKLKELDEQKNKK